MNYPSAIDTEVSLLQPINNFSADLLATIDNVATSVVLSTSQNMSGVHLPSTGVISIDNEVLSYTGITSGPNPTLTGCTRGIDGTTAAAHSEGTAVEVRWVAAHHNGHSDAIIEIQELLGTNPTGVFSTIRDALVNALPVLLVVASPGTNWSFTHTKGARLVLVQCYQSNGDGTYTQFFPNITQDLGADVTIHLGTATAGLIIYN